MHSIKIHCKYDAELPVSQLKKMFNPENPNIHSKEQIEELVAQFKYQGIRDPAKISKRSNLVQAGHGRIEAAAKLGLETYPVVYQDWDDDTQEYAYLTADNAIAAWARLDLSKINLKVPELGPDFDIDRLAIQGFKIDASEKDVIEDEVPEQVEAKTKLGDLYRLGDHRLLCGDSTKPENVSTLVGQERMDMVFTDPPYGVSYTKKNEYLNSLGAGHRLTKTIENDERPVGEMFELWCKIFNITAEFSTITSSYYICSPQSGELMMMMMQAIDQSPWSLKHTLIWNKNNHVLGRCDYHYKHEPILYGWKKKGTHKFLGGGEQTKSVWDIAKPHNSDLHPTMKPIELMENALLNSSEKGMNVIDLFGGSGSTLIACEKTKRKCFMMELDPHYCDVIVARWEKYSGNKAELIKSENDTIIRRGASTKKKEK